MLPHAASATPPRAMAAPSSARPRALWRLVPALPCGQNDLFMAASLPARAVLAAGLGLELLALGAWPRGDFDRQLGGGGMHLVGELGDGGPRALARGPARPGGVLALPRPCRGRPGPRGEAGHGRLAPA